MISIVCPTYNEEKYIGKCIDSILAQDYSQDDMEVILVDGMSTDGTRAIVQEYAKRYPFIRLVDNPQRIVPPAMNIGIRAAKGDIIIRLDAHAIFRHGGFAFPCGDKRDHGGGYRAVRVFPQGAVRPYRVL